MYTHLEFKDFREILSNTQHRKKLNGPKEITIHQEKSSDFQINSTGTENVDLRVSQSLSEDNGESSWTGGGTGNKFSETSVFLKCAQQLYMQNHTRGSNPEQQSHLASEISGLCPSSYFLD